MSDFKLNELKVPGVRIDKGTKIPNSCQAEAICDDDDGDKGNCKCSNLFKLDKFVLERA